MSPAILFLALVTGVQIAEAQVEDDVKAEAVKTAPAGIPNACRLAPTISTDCDAPRVIFFYDQETQFCISKMICPPEDFGNAFASKENCESLCMVNAGSEENEEGNESEGNENEETKSEENENEETNSEENEEGIKSGENENDESDPSASRTVHRSPNHGWSQNFGWHRYGWPYGSWGYGQYGNYPGYYQYPNYWGAPKPPFTPPHSRTGSDCRLVRTGIAMITIPGRANTLKVPCHEGGIVMQRRGQFGNPTDFFYKGWNDYKQGFGDPEGEFWIGLDNLHLLTTNKRYKLRITMHGSGKYDGQTKIANYNHFSVAGAAQKYKLSISGFSSPPGPHNVGDSMTTGDCGYGSHNGQQFATKDTDKYTTLYRYNCAQTWKGAWWYADCHCANLNGFNYCSDNAPYAKGITWHKWGKYIHSLKGVIMSIHE